MKKLLTKIAAVCVTIVTAGTIANAGTQYTVMRDENYGIIDWATLAASNDIASTTGYQAADTAVSNALVSADTVVSNALVLYVDETRWPNTTSRRARTQPQQAAIWRTHTPPPKPHPQRPATGPWLSALPASTRLHRR